MHSNSFMWIWLHSFCICICVNVVNRCSLNTILWLQDILNIFEKKIKNTWENINHSFICLPPPKSRNHFNYKNVINNILIIYKHYLHFGTGVTFHTSRCRSESIYKNYYGNKF